MKPLELSHDIIAKKIWERLPEIDKQLQVVRKSLLQRQQDWAAGKGSFLGTKELAAWEAPIKRLGDSLDQEVLAFIEASKADAEKKEQDRIEQLKKDAQRKRTQLFLVVSVLGFLLAVALAIWALSQQQKAEQATQVAVAAQKEAEDALAALQVEKQKVASLESKLQDALVKDIVPKLEALKINYGEADISQMMHRVLDSLQVILPNEVLKPSSTEVRSSRQIGQWYYDQGRLVMIKDNEVARQQSNLIKVGSILFFGRSNETYSNIDDIDKLTNASGNFDRQSAIIFHLGIVTEVEKDSDGKVTKYTLFHARRPGKPAVQSTGNYDGGSVRVKEQHAKYPFGNWSQQWVAVAYPWAAEE